MDKPRFFFVLLLVLALAFVSSAEVYNTTSAVLAPLEPLQLGQPNVSPGSIATNKATDVWVTIEVPYGEDQLIAPEGDVLSPVEVFKSKNGGAWEHLGYLFDDGDLINHGDEIAGDRIYSNIFNFYEESAITISLRIVVSAGDFAVERISGPDRFVTAVNISQADWDSADTVLLANGRNFPDALAGVPLAHQLDAPILLTEKNELVAATANEISRLGAERVVILGGTAAVSAGVESTLKNMVATVDRIGGIDRFETAQLVAEEMGKHGDFDEAFIALGFNFPDAMSAASYAAMRGSPILLSRSDSIPGFTQEALDELGITNTVVVGGIAVISDGVKNVLPDAERVAGTDRYLTAEELAKKYLAQEEEQIYIATGINFPDALAGGVLAAKNNSGVLLVPGTATQLREHTADFIISRNFESAAIFGGIGAVSEGIENALDPLTLESEFDIEVIEITGGEAVKDILGVHDNAGDILKSAAQADPEITLEGLMNMLHDEIADVEEVKNTTSDDNVFNIEYESGLESFIVLLDEDTRGPSASREAASEIPLSEQTRGDNVGALTAGQPLALNPVSEDEEIEYIESRSVFIWAPFAAEFEPHNETAAVTEIFNNADLGFDVTALSNQDADVASLRGMTNYGFVLLITHGTQGRWLGTGEVVREAEADKYELEQTAGQIAVWQNMDILEGDVITQLPVYAVSDRWISDNLSGTFPNSVILNNSCESTRSDNLWEAFHGKGAGAYFGYSRIVTSRFCVEQAVELVEGMAGNFMTTGEAYTERTDPYSSFFNAVWQFRGKDNLKFASGLLNGSFERGLTAWTTDGDGRSIYALGFVEPTHGNRMGIISTGLGYTIRHGEIKQTFQVPEDATTLSFDWNYLSEEFLQWIGSGFDDPFEVSLITSDDVNYQIMYVSVNSIADDFGAVRAFPGEVNYYDPDGPGGNLVPVSPAIVFDQGDVWMTDWQYNKTYDVSALQGEIVTLKFYATDAVDTIYHTAVLLDNIKVE